MQIQKLDRYYASDPIGSDTGAFVLAYAAKEREDILLGKLWYTVGIISMLLKLLAKYDVDLPECEEAQEQRRKFIQEFEETR